MKIISLKNLKFTPASHEKSDDPGILKKVLLIHKDIQKGTALQMINWAVMPAGKKFEPHYHEDMDEVFIIISGKAKIKVDEEYADLVKGDSVVIPMGTIHEMWNKGKRFLEYLAIGFSLGSGGKTVNV